MASTKFAMRLLHDDRGTSAVEMGLICAMIVLAMLGALQGFANQNTKTWSLVSNKMQAASAQ